MNQKGQLQILIGILVVGLLTLGGYFVYQNQFNLLTKTPNYPVASATPTSIPSSTPIVSRIPLSPEEVTENFYNNYLNCIENHFQNSHERSPRENCPFRSSNLSDELIQRLEEARGHDPILCAQDTPASLSVDKVVIETNKAYTTVHTFYEMSGDNPIKVELTKGNAGYWQITNIICFQ